MNMRITLAMMALLAVSACGAPMPNGQGSKGGARSGQQIVTLGEASFVAEVQPGNAGLVISKAGATAVTGQTVRVTRSGAALGAGDGKLAKQVAMAACGQAGGAFNGQAVGRVVAMGVWAFEGACS
ncbi:hypothetical protein [Neogemmobacter tilapiae]|uniref:DUF5666 domain-containing protein n=1 Tax=Neogemmobacter tilapiae TaxID=875041 RepID=A0A918TTE5_9RHOB|nr:hypothetical protein [Gemmobacter tilapiae]GHC58206.1 hypothetical protein GCM10007315_22240 [Gemmobacter tilapiae]